MPIEELVTRPTGRETEEHEWGEITWLDSADLTGSDGLTVGHVRIYGGCANPEHRHPNCEEALYLLSGTLEHSVGAETTTLDAGDCLHIPRGERHAALNPGDDDAVAVIAYDAGEREFELVE